MAQEEPKKDISSHLADAFSHIAELKKGYPEKLDLLLVELEESMHAIVKEVYALKLRATGRITADSINPHLCEWQDNATCTYRERFLSCTKKGCPLIQ